METLNIVGLAESSFNCCQVWYQCSVDASPLQAPVLLVRHDLFEPGCELLDPNGAPDSIPQRTNTNRSGGADLVGWLTWLVDAQLPPVSGAAGPVVAVLDMAVDRNYVLKGCFKAMRDLSCLPSIESRSRRFATQALGCAPDVFGLDGVLARLVAAKLLAKSGGGYV